MARTEERRPTAETPEAIEVQATVDAETERGYLGEEVDPTPNEAYTIAGVTAGAPTPETDADAAEVARRRALGR